MSPRHEGNTSGLPEDLPDRHQTLTGDPMLALLGTFPAPALPEGEAERRRAAWLRGAVHGDRPERERDGGSVATVFDRGAAWWAPSIAAEATGGTPLEALAAILGGIHASNARHRSAAGALLARHAGGFWPSGVGRRAARARLGCVLLRHSRVMAARGRAIEHGDRSPSAVDLFRTAIEDGEVGYLEAPETGRRDRRHCQETPRAFVMPHA